MERDQASSGKRTCLQWSFNMRTTVGLGLVRHSSSNKERMNGLTSFILMRVITENWLRLRLNCRSLVFRHKNEPENVPAGLPTYFFLYTFSSCIFANFDFFKNNSHLFHSSAFSYRGWRFARCESHLRRLPLYGDLCLP